MKRFNHFIKAIGLELLKNKFFAASYFTYWLRPKNASNYTMQLTGIHGGGKWLTYNLQFYSKDLSKRNTILRYKLQNYIRIIIPRPLLFFLYGIQNQKVC